MSDWGLGDSSGSGRVLLSFSEARGRSGELLTAFCASATLSAASLAKKGARSAFSSMTAVCASASFAN